MKHRVALLALGLALLALADAAGALTLPPSCAAYPPPAKSGKPASLEQLRKKLIAVSEEDPNATMSILCDTIPRVAREKGETSPELAWWAASLATPLIAYFDKFQEAIPLLQFAQPILEQQPKRYAAELGDIHVAYAWIYLREGRLADSADAWEQALKVREAAPGKKQIELQKILVGLAQARMSQRSFKAVHVALDRAKAILKANHETASEAGAAIENLETNLALREENYAAARTHAEAQLAIERELKGGAPQLVPAYVLLGTIDQRLDDFDGAERSLREAIRLAESAQGPLQRHYLIALNQIAVLLNERDRPKEALPFAELALKVAESTVGPEAPRLVAVLRALAEAQRGIGDLPGALKSYMRADRIVEKNPKDIEKQILVAHYRGLGSLELALNDREAARSTLAKALAAAGEDPTLTLERGLVLLALARSEEVADLARQRQLEQALALFQSKLPAAHPVNLWVVNELCAAEVAARNPQAPRCAEAARWVARATDVEPTLKSAVFQNLSSLDADRNDLQAAYASAVQSLSAAEAVATPEPLWRAYFTLAKVLQQSGDPKLAIFFGKRSVEQIERLRSDFKGADLRLERTFLVDKVAVYRTVADWLMARGRIDEGLEVLKLLKEEEQYDYQLRGAEAQGALEYTDNENRLRENYAKALTNERPSEELDRLSKLAEADRLSFAERRRLGDLLQQEALSETNRRERIQAFLSVREALSPGAAATDIKASFLTEELRRLPQGSALGVYLLTQNHLRLLVATQAGQTSVEIAVDGNALQRDIGRFLSAVAHREEWLADSQRLYRTVALPLDEAARKAHAGRLVLWLDGGLRYLPFAALHDGRAFLVEHYVLENYALPGAESRPRAHASVPHVRGMGVTRAVAGFEALPAMADELCDVVRGPIDGLSRRGAGCTSDTTGNGALEGVGFADAAFTETKLRSVLDDTQDYSVLHIGTHFRLRPGNASRSFLVLGDGARLSLDSIAKLKFEGLQLVTLSACQTGLGGATSDDGREIDGLSNIVQRGGAAQVIASLWQVEDRSTALLMRHLYEGMARFKADGAGALRQAQLKLRSESRAGERYEHPFYWAGFVISAH